MNSSMAVSDSRPGSFTAQEKAGATFRTFLKIADKLGLSVEERLQLLGIAKGTYYNWVKSSPGLKPDLDKVDRLAYLVAIYRAAGTAFAGTGDWLRRPNENPVFGGKSPLERMMQGHMEDLRVVLAYLNAAVQVWS